jgi:hypothetical protein
MAINFPNSPTLNEEFTAGDRTWIWDGTVWNSKETAFTTPGIPTGGATAQLLAKVDGADYNTEWKDSDGVRSFADASARATAIPTPTVGMYTHLEDAPQRTEFWNGSDWRSPFGMTLIENRSFVGQTNLLFANIFSATYAHYRLIYRLNGSTNTGVSLRMMTGTTPTSGGTDYTFSRQFWTGTSGMSNNGGSAGQSNISFISQSSGGPTTGYVDIYQPSIALPTMFNGMSQYATLGEILVARHGLSNSYTGIQLDGPANLMTGNIQIYGYRTS